MLRTSVDPRRMPVKAWAGTYHYVDGLDKRAIGGGSPAVLPFRKEKAGSRKAPRLSLGGMESGHQRSQHILQDAAVAVIVHFVGSIDSAEGGETLS